MGHITKHAIPAQTKLLGDILGILDKHRQQHPELTWAELARRSEGLDANRISELARGKVQDPTLYSLMRLVEAHGVKLKVVKDEPGELDFYDSNHGY